MAKFCIEIIAPTFPLLYQSRRNHIIVIRVILVSSWWRTIPLSLPSNLDSLCSSSESEGRFIGVLFVLLLVCPFLSLVVYFTFEVSTSLTDPKNSFFLVLFSAELYKDQVNSFRNGEPITYLWELTVISFLEIIGTGAISNGLSCEDDPPDWL